MNRSKTIIRQPCVIEILSGSSWEVYTVVAGARTGASITYGLSYAINFKAHGYLPRTNHKLRTRCGTIGNETDEETVYSPVVAVSAYCALSAKGVELARVLTKDATIPVSSLFDGSYACTMPKTCVL